MKEYTLQFINKAGDIIGREYFASEEALIKFSTVLIEAYEKEDNNVFALFMVFPNSKEEMLWERETKNVCINCP